MRRLRLLALVAALAAAAGAGACFSPRKPACAFSCAEAGACPADYTCGADGYCHLEGAPVTTCDVVSDGGAPDGASPDAGADAQSP